MDPGIYYLDIQASPREEDDPHAFCVRVFVMSDSARYPECMAHSVFESYVPHCGLEVVPEMGFYDSAECKVHHGLIVGASVGAAHFARGLWVSVRNIKVSMY